MRINVRLNDNEHTILKKVKRIMGIEKLYGADSKAVKSSLDFFQSSWERPIRDFKIRYGKEEQKIIKEAILKGDV